MKHSENYFYQGELNFFYGLYICEIRCFWDNWKRLFRGKFLKIVINHLNRYHEYLNTFPRDRNLKKNQPYQRCQENVHNNNAKQLFKN